MNKYFIQGLTIMTALIVYSPLAMGYTGADCAMANDLADIGLVYKTSNCQGYSLDTTIYRQEVAALALRVAEKCGRIEDIPALSDYVCQNIFYDVGISRPNSWACRSVEILADNGIITTSRRDNFGRTYFGPTKDITRSEALSIIMDSAGLDFRGSSYDDWRFTGTGAVTWQKPVMQYANDHDIISSISSFRPNGAAYRKEVFSYVQKSFENCDNNNNNNNNNNGSNNSGDNLYITADTASPSTNSWVDFTIRARDGTSTDTSYRGTVNFDVYYRSSSSSSWIKTTSSSYYEMSNTYKNGYTFNSSDRGQRTLSNLIRFKKNNYSYKVVVTDDNDSDIEGYKIFTVGNSSNNTNDTDNLYITADTASPSTNSWVDFTIRARDGTSTDTSYRGTVNFDVYYRSSSSSSWIKTTSSSYYEMSNTYKNGYTFNSSDRGQRTLSNLIRFKKNNYSYKVVVTDDNDSDIEGYKIFTVGSNYNGDDCGYGEYSSGNNCYSCSTRPSNAYYTDQGSCDWECNSGYTENNGYCEYDTQSCGIGQYLSGNSCYNCNTKPSSAQYTDYGTCDWSCQSGYYRDGNMCVSNYQNCSIGQYAIGNTCQSCLSAPSNSYYTTAGSCSWTCNTNYYSSGNQCVPYTQNCGIGQYLVGNVCANCSTKPSNSLYSQNGTCDWTCEYGYMRDGNACVVAQLYSWYTSPNWGTCSVSCGGGTQTRTVECRSTIGYTVNDWLCTGTMPSASQSCNTQACNSWTYDWKQGNWGTCINNNRDRTIVCERDDGNIVSSSYCNAGTRPASSESCVSTTYSWDPGNWGTCSGGSQARSVVCRNNSGSTVSNSYCNAGTKPATSQSCNSWTYDWKQGNWGTCINNNRDRTIVCERDDGNIVSSSYCNAGTRPASSESCVSTTYSWDPGNWGTCSGGSQARSVVCRNNSGSTVSNSYCNAGTKPATSQSCMTYSWDRGNTSTCVATCNTARPVICKNSNGQVVADSNCSGSKPAHVCARTFVWVDTDGTQSCNTVCNNQNSCWIHDEQEQACASGEKVPTWGTFHFLFGKINNPTKGGYWVWPHNGAWYCGNTNVNQEPAYRATTKVISCLCQ